MKNYIVKGLKKENYDTYNSHNTERLSISKIIKLLKKSDLEI